MTTSTQASLFASSVGPLVPHMAENQAVVERKVNQLLEKNLVSVSFVRAFRSFTEKVIAILEHLQ
jgi:hypothetical protein